MPNKPLNGTAYRRPLAWALGIIDSTFFRDRLIRNRFPAGAGTLPA